MLTHDIDVGNSLPVKQNAYRVNPNERAIMKEEVAYVILPSPVKACGVHPVYRCPSQTHLFVSVQTTIR